jgi:FkbM family methyltransferase
MNEGAGKVICKPFPSYTQEQVKALYTHAQAIFAALKDAPCCQFEEPLSHTATSITYRYFDSLPPSLSDLLRSRACTEGGMRRVGKVLAALHAQTSPDGHNNLLHGDFVPHNVFCSVDKLFIIDAHPPEQLPYRDDLLSGDRRRDVISLLFGIFSNVGLKAVILHGRYYCAMARSFVAGYQAVRPCEGSLKGALLHYIADVYKMRHTSLGSLRAALHGLWCGAMVLFAVKKAGTMRRCKKAIERFIRWLGRFVIGSLSPHRNYVLITPPAFARQVVFSKRALRFRAYKVRSLADYNTLVQMFYIEDYCLVLDREKEIITLYQAMVEKGQIPLIIDCGANIGLSADYFAQMFPKARIVAIEPDQNNIELAAKNCRSPYVHFIHAGIASEKGSANLIDPQYGEWGYRTEMAEGGATKMLSVPSLLDENKDATPLIIKIDIEGFESELFSKDTQWIDQFDLLIIELHDWMLPKEANSQSFLKTIAPLDRDFVYRNENVFSLANHSRQLSEPNR